MSKRQLSQVIDLNKCIGCHTCSISCKKLWTDRNGREYMYWNNVETKPGKGYPKDWERGGGGFKTGVLQLGDEVPPLEEYGIPWDYDSLKASLLEGTGEQVLPHYKGKKSGPSGDQTGMRTRVRVSSPTLTTSIFPGSATTVVSLPAFLHVPARQYTRGKRTA